MQPYIVYLYEVSWEMLIPSLQYSLDKKCFLLNHVILKVRCMMKGTTVFKLKHSKLELTLLSVVPFRELINGLYFRSPNYRHHVVKCDSCFTVLRLELVCIYVYYRIGVYEARQVTLPSEWLLGILIFR